MKSLLIALTVIFGFFFITPQVIASTEEAVFAGGCFWCLEHDLEDLQGVISVQSGYSGGDLSNPTYSHHEGHQEAVIVNFDSLEISYEELLRSYWRNVDPLDGDGQFCDRGNSYRPVIFTKGSAQENDASNSLDFAAKELAMSGSQIKVEIKPLKKFWLAEEYHQNYARLNTIKYKFYRFSCGRDLRLEEVWGARAREGAAWARPQDQL